MGCFGDMEPVKTINSTASTSPPAWVEAAGQQNYNQARGILDQGFQPYTGQMVAPLSENERTASDMVGRTASSGNPYSAEAASSFRGYGGAPGYQYNFNTVADQNGPLGSTQGYMNPYLDAVLAPMLRQLGISGAQARQGINANATQSGAYGDARHGVVESEQRKNQALQETDTVGKAFSDAYAQAMQQRQSDSQRQFATQQAQEGADKSALERSRTSGIDLTNLDKYDVSRALGLSGALGQTGATERGVAQQGNDAAYAEAMRKQGFTDSQVAFLTAILKGTPTSQTSTGNQVTSQPNNSGFQALGSGLGSAASLAAMLFL